MGFIDGERVGNTRRVQLIFIFIINIFCALVVLTQSFKANTVIILVVGCTCPTCPCPLSSLYLDDLHRKLKKIKHRQ